MTFSTGLTSTGTRLSWHPQAFCHGYIPDGRRIEVYLTYEITVTHSSGAVVWHEEHKARLCYMSFGQPNCSFPAGGVDCDTTPGTLTFGETYGYADSDYGSSRTTEERAACN